MAGRGSERQVGPGTAAALLLSALAWSPSAHAIGATAESVKPLLPQDGATGVPLNAVLQASTSLSRATFELIEFDSGDTVATIASCDGHFDGNLCAGSGAPLKPGTEYRWKASAGEEPVETEVRSFVTGSSTDDSSPVSNDWLIDVVNDESLLVQGLESVRRVTFQFTANDLSEAVVLTVPGYFPSSEEHALVVEGGVPVEFALNDPPECFSVRLSDVAGNSKTLQAHCLERADDESVRDGGAGASSSGGCTVRRPGARGDEWMPLALAITVLRRRRSRTAR